MFMNQLDETFEYLFLTIYSFGLFLQEQVLGLVIEVQNEVLNEIFEDLNAETIIPVFIKIFHDQAEPDEWFYTFFRDDNAWMLFRKWKKEGSRREVISWKGCRKNNIGNGKIMAGAGTIEDTAGEKQKLGVLRHFVRLQINFYVGFSATAMKNRCVC